MNTIIQDDCKTIVDELKDRFQVFEGKTILITGAQGFLCSYVVEVLALYNTVQAKEPVKIIALDNFITGSKGRLQHLQGRNDIDFVTQDITDPYETTDPVNFIIHGASIASPIFYREHPLETLDANVSGTRNMLELAKKQNCESVLIMSSSEVYGDPAAECIPTPETYWGNTSFTGPRACYDESKRVAETISVIFAQKYGVNVKMARPFNVFGPGLRLDDRRVMPDFLNSILNDLSIILLSDGKPTRTFCYVSDAVRAMFLILLCGQSGEPYNMGNDKGEISMYNLAELVSKVGSDVLNRPTLPVIREVSEDKEYLTDNPQRRCPDLSKIKRDTGYTPLVSLEDGVARTLRSYLTEEEKKSYAV